MSFRDGYVKETGRILLREAGKARSVRHGSGHGTDAGVFRGAFHQCRAEYGGEVLSSLLFRFAGRRIKGADAVELAGSLLRVGIAFALHRLDVDHHRRVQLLCPLQHVAQAGQIVAVDGAEIRKAHIFKQRTDRPEGFLQRGLYPVIEAVDGTSHGMLAKEAAIPFFKVIVGLLAAKIPQMRRHGAYVGIDGHAVIVDDHDDRLAGGTGVVQAFVGHTAGEGAVADQSQDAGVLVLQRSSAGHAQRNGNGVGGVACNECVMLALMGLRKARKPSELTEGGKQLAAARQGFVDVTLMAHVKDQAVLRRIEHAVDGYGQLHRAQVGCQVAAGLADLLHQKGAKLLAKQGKLLFIQLFNVSGRLDGFQDHKRSFFQRRRNRDRKRPAR